MIQVKRGPEPASLQKNRDRNLARAIIDNAAGRKPKTTGYGVARSALYTSHNQKCVFCEQQQAKKQLPVEHYRPKNKATGKNQPPGEPGYWWLAWTWKNLLFACHTCNSGYKKDHFPLEDPGTRLAEQDTQVHTEKQTLIDPVVENPLTEIQFLELASHWTPQGRNGSIRGQQTVQLLGLDAERLDLYDAHVDLITQLTCPVQESIDGNKPQPDVQAAWKRALGAIFAPLQPYHSLSYWALQKLFPTNVRSDWKLELEPPGNSAVDPPTTDVAHPYWASLPTTLRLHLRAMGDSKQWIDRALLEACKNSPCSQAELIALTRKPPAAITSRLGYLVGEGKLELSANEGYRCQSGPETLG